jgi:hypothetical protein
MPAIESRTMNPTTTSQIATCCVVLNVMAPTQARTCVMAAKIRTKPETKRVDAEKVSPSVVPPGIIDRSQVFSMVPPLSLIEADYPLSLMVSGRLSRF